MSATEAERWVVAVVTEHLHRRQLDDTQPIQGDPFSNKEAGDEWLARLAVEEGLIHDLLFEGGLEDGETGAEEVVGALVSFAASAVEMWARPSGKDPQAVVRAVAIQQEALRGFTLSTSALDWKGHQGRPGSCVGCGHGTDTAIAVRGEAQWLAAFLVVLGVPADEASDTVIATLGTPATGQVPAGVLQVVFQVCTSCASASAARLPAPALATLGQLPLVAQPGIPGD